ncbi:MAG: hypothetical protein JST79_04545 [Acidobacteria bacterium]|nr:hypothetical protein [Acidobacteriota bacterium]
MSFFYSPGIAAPQGCNTLLLKVNDEPLSNPPQGLDKLPEGHVVCQKANVQVANRIKPHPMKSIIYG